MMTCSQARLLLRYDGVPGPAPKGIPELGFHIAMCAECRYIWESDYASSPGSACQVTSLHTVEPLQAPVPVPYQVAHRDIQPAQAHEITIVSDDPEPLSVPVLQPSAYFIAEETEVSSEAQQAVTYRSLLQNPDFRSLWVGQAISTFGSYFTRIAIPIYVFNLTQSYTLLGLAYFSSLIASLIFGLIAGALADRWDRRKIMIWADILNALVLFVLMLVVIFPFPVVVKLGAIYVVGFQAALLRELFSPARIAIFADLLSGNELLVANSLDRATITVTEFLSYPLAALVLALVGPAIAFGVDAITFAVSALFISVVSPPRHSREALRTSTLWAEIAEGLNVARNIPVVRKIVILSLVVPLVMSLHTTLLLPFTLEALQSTETVGFPALSAVEVAGLFMGTLLLQRYAQQLPRALLLAYGILGYGLALFLQGLVPWLTQATAFVNTPVWLGSWTVPLLIVLPIALIGGAANSLILASLRTLIQECTPRAILGRVYSITSVAAGLGFAAGALLTGAGQGRVAMFMTLLGGGVALLGLLSIPWLREKQVLPVLEPNGSA